ncbi:alpha/beta hydrolase [Pseudactinotalea suaedae]
MWRVQSRALTAAGVEHVAVDLPGHGRREGEPFTLAGCREVLDAAVGSLRPPHVVVGFSLGSYVAIDWAGTTAEPPSALVLASAGTRPRGVGLAGYLAVARAIGRLPDRGLGLHTFLARRVLDGETVADLMAGGVALDAMVPTLRAVGGLDVLETLARLETPIWFVNGTLDHFRAEERLLLRAARHATLQLIPRAGHLVALDQPEAFNDVLMDVIEHVDLRPAGP